VAILGPVGSIVAAWPASADISASGNGQVKIEPGHAQAKAVEHRQIQQIGEPRCRGDSGVVNGQQAAFVLGQDVHVMNGKQVTTGLIACFQRRMAIDVNARRQGQAIQANLVARVTNGQPVSRRISPERMRSKLP
jgi:hypothetical protein